MGGGERLRDRVGILQQEQERRRALARLRRTTLRKSEFLRRKAVIDTHETYSLIKEFFRHFLDKHYEFTINELRKELHLVFIPQALRVRLDDLFTRMAAIEYANVHYPRQELDSMLREFEAVVSMLVADVRSRQGIFARLRSVLFKDEPEAQVTIAELPVVEGQDPLEVQMRTLAERCYTAHAAGSARKSRAAYAKLLEAYGALPAAEQERYFTLVDRTYRELRRQ